MHWWLVQVAGTSGKVQQTADEDAEGISSDAHGAAISEALGMERRNEVRASYTALLLPLLAHCGIPIMIYCVIGLFITCAFETCCDCTLLRPWLV